MVDPSMLEDAELDALLTNDNLASLGIDPEAYELLPAGKPLIDGYYVLGWVVRNGPERRGIEFAQPFPGGATLPDPPPPAKFPVVISPEPYEWHLTRQHGYPDGFVISTVFHGKTVVASDRENKLFAIETDKIPIWIINNTTRGRYTITRSTLNTIPDAQRRWTYPVLVGKDPDNTQRQVRLERENDLVTQKVIIFKPRKPLN